MITVTRVIYIDSKSSKVVNDTFQSVKEAKAYYGCRVFLTYEEEGEL